VTKQIKLATTLVLTLFAVGFVTLVLSPVTTQAQDLDMESILRCHTDEPEGQALCDEGRNIIIENCTACHTFVPIVLQQFDEAGWKGLLDRHHARASALSEEQFETLGNYLALNFNEEQEPPELPAELLNNWTAY